MGNEKCYYGYCRPKLPNYPWSLEKIPIGRTVLVTSKDVELKHKKSIPFDIKVTDDVGITLNADGTFTLPIGRYLIETQFTASIPVIGNIAISVGNHTISNYLQPESPTTMASMFLADITNDSESIGVFNVNKESVKLTDCIIVITKL